MSKAQHTQGKTFDQIEIERLLEVNKELLEALEYGLVGREQIILLNNAAALLEEFGGPAATQLAAGLREKGRKEFAAIAKAKGE